jgi:hypothetical protein
MTVDLPSIPLLLRWVVLPSIVAALVVLGCGRTCRWLWRVSKPAGALASAGAATRLIVGLALFWTSYLQLPFLTSQQLGGGFWRMALDARGYYLGGLFAAEQGASTLPAATPSPAYVQALAVWMSVVGTSPFSAVLFNIACYLATCALIVAVLRGLPSPHRDRLTTVIIATITASPMMLFVTTQVLKDSFFVLFAVVLSIGAWWTLSAIADPEASWRRLVPGVLACSVGVFVTAGIRVYYPAIVIACLAGGLLGALLSGLHRRRLMFQIGGTLLTLVLAAGALAFGSDEGRRYLELLSPNQPLSALNRLDTARQGFVTSGGGTNVAAPALVAPAVAPPIEASERLEDLAIGAATVFVPLSVLRAASVVDVSAGLSMMALGDLDTLFFDATLVLAAVMLFRLRRDIRGNVPYLVFAILMIVLLSAMMAYTVTNVGTLVRLRLMILVPVWTLAFGFARPPRQTAIAARDEATLTVPFSSAVTTPAE